MKHLYMMIGEDRLDLMTLPVMDMGLKRRLFLQTKINYADTFTPDQEVKFCHFMLQLLRPQTTIEEIEARSTGLAQTLYWAVGNITTSKFDPVGLPTLNPDPNFIPLSGQAGKDVIWVPTPEAIVHTMLDVGEVGPDTNLIDLGSGDGRTVVEAARRGATATGYELNPDMVVLSRARAAEAARGEAPFGRAQFIQDDFFNADLTEATVITLYLLPALNLRLRARLLSLKPGTKIISHQFDMGGWDADTATVVGTKLVFSWEIKHQ